MSGSSTYRILHQGIDIKELALLLHFRQLVRG
jgi:hypothetical protein